MNDFFFLNLSEIYTEFIYSNFCSCTNLPPYLLEISEDRMVGRGPKASYFTHNPYLPNLYFLQMLHV